MEKLIKEFNTTGYITIFKGQTYPLRQWFKNNGAKYKPIWGWYFPYGATLPEKIPEGISAYQLPAENVYDSEFNLFPKEIIKKNIEELLYEPGTSKYVGTIGERLVFSAYVIDKKSIPIDPTNPYDTYNIYLLKDTEDNLYVWKTESERLEEQEWQLISGTVKNHQTFQNTKQTILTNVRRRKSRE